MYFFVISRRVFAGFSGEKADFLLFDGKFIIEVKNLETDPEGKIPQELDRHRNRPEFPLIYGVVGLEKILNRFPDGEAIYRRIDGRVTRNIEALVRKANRQIGATAESLALKGPVGA